MSSAVAGYKADTRRDAPPACYDDIDAAKILFIAGSNTAWAHPILYRRIEAARQRDPSVRTIVVDPRRTATAADADLHLAIEPGTDVALFHGMLHVMLWEERSTASSSPRTRKASRHCARPCASTRRKSSRRPAGSPRTTSSPRRGGSRGGRHSRCTARASTNRRPARPRMPRSSICTSRPVRSAREGAGPFSLTGQPNAMGGREVGGLANLLSAHRDLADPAHRAEVAALWGVDDVPRDARPDGGRALRCAGRRAREDGLDRLHESRAVDAGPGDGARRPRTRGARRAAGGVSRRRRLPRSRTSQLPASDVGREGRHRHQFRAPHLARARGVAPPGEARADWEIAVDFARRLEDRLRPGMSDAVSLRLGGTGIRRARQHYARARPRHHGAVARRSSTSSDRSSGRVRESQERGTARLYTDFRFATPDGRARFLRPGTRPSRSASTRAIRSVSTPDACATSGMR